MFFSNHPKNRFFLNPYFVTGKTKSSGKIDLGCLQKSHKFYKFLLFFILLLFFDITHADCQLITNWQGLQNAISSSGKITLGDNIIGNQESVPLLLSDGVILIRQQRNMPYYNTQFIVGGSIINNQSQNCCTDRGD